MHIHHMSHGTHTTYSQYRQYTLHALTVSLFSFLPIRRCSSLFCRPRREHEDTRRRGMASASFENSGASLETCIDKVARKMFSKYLACALAGNPAGGDESRRTLSSGVNYATTVARVVYLLHKVSGDTATLKVPLRALRDEILAQHTAAAVSAPTRAAAVDALFKLFDGIHEKASASSPSPSPTKTKASRAEKASAGGDVVEQVGGYTHLHTFTCAVKRRAHQSHRRVRAHLHLCRHRRCVCVCISASSVSRGTATRGCRYTRCDDYTVSPRRRNKRKNEFEPGRPREGVRAHTLRRTRCFRRGGSPPPYTAPSMCRVGAPCGVTSRNAGAQS